MTYKSRKDETITAVLDYREEKYKTCMMIYTSGPDKGKSFNITEATLKRWWKPVEKSANEILNVDLEKVNTPYPEPKVQKYIPKPKSVIEYEEKKKRFKTDLPTFDVVCDILGSVASKINERSEYLTMNDRVTTVWRKTSNISIYTVSEYIEKFSDAGLIAKENKDVKRPIAYTIKSNEDFEKAAEVLKNLLGGN